MIDQQENTPTISRKDREKQARQQDILNAARKIFALKGYHATTLEEIAREAEFGKGTIYNYFANKQDLFFAILYQLLDEMIELAQTTIHAPNGSARERLTIYARGIFSHAKNNADLFALIIREIHQLNVEERDIYLQQFNDRIKIIWDILAQLFDEEIKASRIKSFDPLMLAHVFDGMLRWYCVNQFKHFQSFLKMDIDEAVKLIISIFYDGVSDRVSD